jgi:hypothetical protein
MDKLALAGLTAQFGNATLLGVAGTTVNLSVATTYSIRGKMYSKAASNTEATPTTDINTGAAFLPVNDLKASIFVLCLNSSGALKVAQGKVLDTDAAGNVLGAFEFPAIPDDLCPIGYLTVKASSAYVATTTGWLFGTHNTSGVTGITYAFTNVSTLPDRPATA